MKKSKLHAIIGVIFSLVGIGLLVAGVAVSVTTVRFMVTAERVDGTVVDMVERTTTHSTGRGSSTDTAWHPMVEFSVDGKPYSFQGSVGSSPPAYEVGDTVEVAYDPSDPHDARLASFWSAYFLPLILGGIGIVFTPIGVVLLVKAWRIRALRAWLRRNGREVWAEIAHIGPEFRIRVNGRHPYVVRATWRDASTGRTHTATSDYLRHDPGPRLQGQTHVRVLFDPANPDRNVLDLDTASGVVMSSSPRDRQV